MAPQTHIPPAANILGTIGTVCWCVQLIPQIWTNYRRKSTEGLPASMMILWACSAVPFGIYAVVQNLNIPIQCQAQIFAALSLITWGQILYYGRKWSVWKAVGLPLGFGGVLAGLEAGGIVGIRIPNGKGITWPITTIGILAAILLAAGLLPPYYEIYIRRGRVVGINMWFLFIDACGAFFSLMSLVAQHEFDLLGSVQYSGCLALEIGIFCLWGADLGRRWWRVRKGLAAEEGEVVKGVGVRGSESGSEVDEEEVGGAVKKLDGGKSAKGTKGDDANV